MRTPLYHQFMRLTTVQCNLAMDFSSYTSPWCTSIQAYLKQKWTHSEEQFWSAGFWLTWIPSTWSQTVNHWWMKYISSTLQILCSWQLLCISHTVYSMSSLIFAELKCGPSNPKMRFLQLICSFNIWHRLRAHQTTRKWIIWLLMGMGRVLIKFENWGKI